MIVRIVAAIVQLALFAGVGSTAFGAVQDGRTFDAVVLVAIGVLMTAGAMLGHVHARRRVKAQRIEAQIRRPGHKVVGAAIHGRY